MSESHNEPDEMFGAPPEKIVLESTEGDQSEVQRVDDTEWTTPGGDEKRTRSDTIPADELSGRDL